jgi:hypothetical protein
MSAATILWIGIFLVIAIAIGALVCHRVGGAARNDE